MFIHNIKKVYEDENILIVFKPSNMLSHSAKTTDLKNLLDVLKKPNYHVITRLDTHTEGLVLLAKNSMIASKLSQLGETGNIRKKYLAICNGYLPKSEDQITAYLLKDSENSVVRLSSVSLPESSEIITEYKVLKESYQFSLVEISLITGKTHQIRAHFAHIGHPLLGDPLYGNRRINQSMHQTKQMLVAYKLEFIVEETTSPLYYLDKKVFEIESHPIKTFLK